uniref:GTPase-activating protein CdGAPr n=1 Tax=Anopheles culicifacies TaxID=139723 RepID=A0A182MTY1_9DIPT
MSQIMRKDSSIGTSAGGGHRHRSIDIGHGAAGSESSIMDLHHRTAGPPPRSAPPTGAGGSGKLPLMEKPRTISDSESEINYDLFNTSIHSADSGSAIMNASQISTTSCDSTHIKSANLTRSQNAPGSCRFPKLEECAHFHYERVQLGNLSVQLEGDERSDSQLGLASDLTTSQTNSIGPSGPTGSACPSKSGSNLWFIIRVTAGRSDPFMIKRSYENMCFLDEMLHRCVYDRRVSELENLRDVLMALPDSSGEQRMERSISDEQHLEKLVGAYLARLSMIASDAMTCGPVLTWLQIDNKGRRLPVADEQTMRCINTPAVGAAYGVRRYVAQACDEISIEVGDMISVIDMPSPAESIWWRGKKSHLQKNQYEVGFFPQSCVATIGDKVPRHMPFPAPLVGSLAVSPTKPVLRKHGKLIAFFRSFILSRPSRRRLKQSGIYKERVFSCDLGEHLLNSGQDIPMVLKCCAEFIEEYGIVDGIYRLSGITSNIQKLRRAFDEERIPDLTHPDIRQDIHAVSSLLKMYFRELPNPLCTYQLYDHFVEAIQTRLDAPTDLKLRLIRQTVQKLPPPHYRTLKYLATHLFKISRHSANTGMTERNIAIVWAPNLLRSPALESGGVAALRGVGVQAVVTEYLISNCEQIFDDTADDFGSHYIESQPNSLSDTNSVQNYGGAGSDQQELSLSMERPKSLSVGGAKLLSLEEARIRKNCMEQSEKTIPINITNPSTHIGSYIEVGGGPSSLPDKYHTVLPVPRSWNKRKSHSSWKSIFTRQPRQSNSNSDIKGGITSVTISDKNAPMVTSAMQPEMCGSSLVEVEDKDIDHRRSVSIKESSSGLLDKMAKRHSRSVSHDSYFDLLQSPIRGGTIANGTASGGGVVTCPSRELSELGLNFDREEPEMRIFSESESLVSSPKVAKESVRRTLRARPEDYIGSGHSVNPSPKKQPRLNIPSPTQENNKQWNMSALPSGNGSLSQDDESLCKRYKLEDQLSDIQFIDCSTPEHTSLGVGNSGPQGGSTTSSTTVVNTIFTSAQVHKPPQQEDSSDEQHDDETLAVGLRNSYPGPQYAYAKYNTSPVKETRFSYPGTGGGAGGKEKIARKEKASQSVATTNSVVEKVQSMSVDEQNQPQSPTLDQLTTVHPPPPPSAPSSSTGAKVSTPQSPPVPSPCYSLLIGSTSSDTTSNSNINTPVYDEMDITGAFTAHLEHQQHAKETPVDDSPNAAPAGGKPTTVKKHDLKAMKRELSLDLSGTSTKLTGSTNFTSDNTTTNTSQSLTPSDFAYQNLNPDLSPNGGLGATGADGSVVEMTSFSQKAAKSPGTPIKATINITYNVRSPVRKEQEGNVFRSCSPPRIMDESSNTHADLVAEEEYQRERRSIYENVLVPTVEEDEEKDGAMDDTSPSKRLLETNFDETMVYEQVKFLKNVVSEVNHLVKSEAEPRPMEGQCDSEDAAAAQRIVPDLNPSVTEDVALTPQKKRSTVEDGINNNHNDGDIVAENGESIRKQHERKAEKTPHGSMNEEENEDVPMSDVNEDSLEFDNTDVSLYENVELRKKSNYPLYENVESSNTIQSCSPPTANNPTDTLKSVLTEDEFSSLCADRSDLDNEMEYRIEIPPKIELTVSPKSKMVASAAPDAEETVVSVKQLATKFETSPVDVTPPFDFSGINRGHNHHFRSSLNNGNYGASERVTIRNKSATSNSGSGSVKDDRHAFASFTRSLDENAFVREFGSGRGRLEGGGAFVVVGSNGFNKSSQQIPAVEKNILNENNPNRRKSLELSLSARPRSMNQPKKLPPLGPGGAPTGVENVDMNGADDGSTKGKATSECCRAKALQLGSGGHKQAAGGSPSEPSNMKLDLSMKIEDTKEARAYNVRITPTTENRISLVQYNYCDGPTNNSGTDSMMTDSGAGSPTGTPLMRVVAGRKGENFTDDDRNSITSLKMLGSCKLDRSRIEKIKEERRHQLSEKYRSESFKGERGDYGSGANGKLKSKSKSELREFKEDDLVADRADKKYDSLRFRSKSRAELLSSDGPFPLVDSSCNPVAGKPGSVSLNTVAITTQSVGLRPTAPNRTRRISDEKNQNDLPPVANAAAAGPIASDASMSQVCDNKFELKTRQKFDVKRSSMDYPVSSASPSATNDVKDAQPPQQRDQRHSFSNGRSGIVVTRSNSSSSNSAQRDRCSPPISIKDVAAMFESRSQQNQS